MFSYQNEVTIPASMQSGIKTGPKCRTSDLGEKDLLVLIRIIEDEITV